MAVSDPVADFLTGIRNAIGASFGENDVQTKLQQDSEPSRVILAKLN